MAERPANLRVRGRALHWALLAVFCLSGAAGLVYEVTWTRLLGLVFGNTTYAVATTLAAFMAGLALGSAVFGRRADASPSPLRLYAGLELGIAVTGGLTPFVLPALSPLLAAIVRGLGGAAGEVTPLLTAARFLVTFAILVVPTALMGATLPVLVRYFVREREGVGSGVGVLYAVNTLGAVGGAFLTGFVLLRLLGVGHTIFLAAGINVLAAAVARIAASRLPTGVPRLREEPGETLTGLRRHAALGIFALSGAAALAYEVLFTRTLVLTLNTTTYAFATMLTTFLAGLALGSALAAPLTRRLRNLPLAFAITQLGIGLTALASVAVIAGLRSWVAGLCQRLGLEGPPTLPIWFLQCSAAMLPTALLSGATFPLVSAIYARRVDVLGRSVGDLYCANTIGAVAGSVVGGFVLLPLLGLRGGLLATVLMSLALGVGAVVLLGPSAPGRRPARQALAVAGAAALIALGGLIVPPWQARALLVSPPGADTMRGEPLFIREGATATVVVFDGYDGERYVEINAQTASLTEYSARQTFSLLAHLPTLLHPRPRQALVIGFGAGMTLGAVTQHPELERIVCVEICPEVYEAAPLFDAYNGRPLQDRRVHAVVNDGRNFLQISQERFDIITCDPTHPHAAGDAALYTADFFRLALDHLAPGGVFCQWLPIHGLRPDTYRLILRTFLHSFPAAYVWFEGKYCILVGTQEPLLADVDRIEEALRLPAIRADLARVHLAESRALLAACVAYGDPLQRLAGPGPLHTDDHPRLEFQVSRTRDPWMAQVLGLLRDAQVLEPFGLAGKAATADFEAKLRRRLATRPHYLEGLRRAYAKDLAAAVAAFDEGLTEDPEAPDIRYLRDVNAYHLAGGLSQRMAERVRAGDYAGAATIGRQLVQLTPDRAEYWAGLATVYSLMEQPEQALDASRQAVRLDPSDFDARYTMGVALLKLGRYDESAAQLEEAVRLEPQQAAPYLRLGMAYARAGRREEAIGALRRALLLDPSLEIAREELRDLGATLE